jgi:large subunit ribosomal protein L4
METIILNQEGKESGKITLPETVFGIEWNPDLVHEVVVSMTSNARDGNAHTKDRGEVRGGGKKPWRQKGTGRARHGSSRSPIWTGGGNTFGPNNEKDYSKKINKKVRAKALASTLSKKHADGEVVFLDQLNFTEPKAAEAKKIISAVAIGSNHADMATKSKNSALFVLSERNEAVEKSFRNFGHVLVAQAKDINPVDLLTYKYVVVTEPAKALETLVSRIGTTSKSEK